jgi:thermitase
MQLRALLASTVTAILVGLQPALGHASPAAAQGRPSVPHRPEVGRPGQEPPAFVAGQILVKFTPGAAGQQVAAAHRQGGGRTTRVLGDLDVHVVEVPPGQERARAAAYRANPNVEFSEVDGIYVAVAATGPDPLVGDQWQYDRIDAPEAWQATRGSLGVAIAILDSGIDQDHPDLQGKVTKSANFTASPTLDDRYGHGTHVAGSAAALTDNATGVAGTCPACALYNVKVLDDQGNGTWSSIADGIGWAVDNRAKVINMSLGGYAVSRTLELAVNRAWNKGAALVGAAGNGDEHGVGQNWGFYPSAYDKVIAVAATDAGDAKGGFSNFGGNWVDVAAPGVGILSTAPNHPTGLWPTAPTPPYAPLNGTSMAAPHVAGIAGLAWSKAGLCSTNTCVRGRIQATAQRIDGTGTAYTQYWAHGRVNACRAVGGTCP